MDVGVQRRGEAGQQPFQGTVRSGERGGVEAPARRVPRPLLPRAGPETTLATEDAEQPAMRHTGTRARARRAARSTSAMGTGESGIDPPRGQG